MPFRRVLIGIKGTSPRRYRKGWQRVVPAAVSWRTRIQQAMTWALAHEAEIHYQQVRPFDPRLIERRHLPITTDCSGSTTMLYRAAGRPDPNGSSFNGYGFTGTLRRRMPRRSHVGQCRVGDLIIYGTDDGSHVVVVYKTGRDPLVFSHGQEAGPFLIRHSEELRAHGSYHTCHDGGRL